MSECSTCPSNDGCSKDKNSCMIENNPLNNVKKIIGVMSGKGGVTMKIAISAEGKTAKNLLDMRFGRCEFFQVHDMDSGEVKTLENKGQSSSGGAGISAANQLIDEKVDVIITGNLGPNAFELIEKGGIKAYKCESIAITSVLEKYENGELEEIKVSGPAHHGGAH